MTTQQRSENNNVFGGDRHVFYRAGSYGMFEHTYTSGTLDFKHCSGIGNGTPCIIVRNKGKTHADRTAKVGNT